MDYKTKNLPRSQIEINVTVSHDELKPLLEKAAGSLSHDSPVEGFRPGKAPLDIVKQKFGEYAVYEAAAKIFIQKNYLNILEGVSDGADPAQKDGVPPASRRPRKFIGQPEISITKLAPGQDLEFKITLSVVPELKLPDYKKIALKISKEKKTVEIQESEIEDALKYIRESRATLITVSRPAQNGDAVEVDFETFEGATKLPGMESKNHPVVIGEKKFIPGFEEELIGTSRGDTKEFSVKLPDTFQDKNIAGKEVRFRVTVNLVQERALPELTDEFARSLGNFSGAENLKKNIREGVMMEKEQKERDRIRMRIADEIAHSVDIDIPEILINAELEKMVNELKTGVEQMGYPFQDYLMNIKKGVDDLKLGWVNDAKRRVLIALVLGEIAKEESIEPTEDEVQMEADRFVMRSGASEKEIKKIDKANLFEYARGVARNEKTFQFLENADGHI